RVGWVERSETPHLAGSVVGLAALDPPYERIAAANSAENRQLEGLPEAIHTAETERAQPATLLPDRRHDIRATAGTVAIVAVQLLSIHRLAKLAAAGEQMIGHGAVEQILDARRRTGDVFAVDERAAHRQQVEDLAVQRPLAFVRQMVDGEAADNGV